jgi:hypothetical protein
LNAVGQTMTGRKSAAEGVIEIAFALLPFGLGKVAGKLVGGQVAAIHRATSEAAAESLMKSKAGQGTSGYTRSVARAEINQVAADAAPWLVSNPVVGLRSTPRMIAEWQAMSGLKLQSGGVSDLIVTASQPGRMWTFGGAWSANEEGSPLGEFATKEATAPFFPDRRTERNEEW